MKQLTPNTLLLRNFYSETLCSLTTTIFSAIEMISGVSNSVYSVNDVGILSFYRHICIKDLRNLCAIEIKPFEVFRGGEAQKCLRGMF